MNSKYRLLWPVCAAAIMSISFPGESEAQKKTDAESRASTEFVRLTRNGQDLLALQTAIARYELAGDSSTTVDLIGAVHIGEAAYYKTLNDLFTDYDVVLYELVAPEGTRIPSGRNKGRSRNPISFLQVSAQKFLGLESQLENVDYSPENFRHADMSPAQLAEKMRERGESPLSLAIGAFTEMMNDPKMAQNLNGEQGGISLSDIADMMTDPLKAKRFMAQQMSTMGNMEAGLGSSLTRLIVDDRNAAAMTVLNTVLKEDKKKVAIFYGAAHMSDFEQRLLKKNFRQTTRSWLTAWDLTRSYSKPADDSAMSLLMQLMKELKN